MLGDGACCICTGLAPTTATICPPRLRSPCVWCGISKAPKGSDPFIHVLRIRAFDKLRLYGVLRSWASRGSKDHAFEGCGAPRSPGMVRLLLEKRGRSNPC